MIDVVEVDAVTGERIERDFTPEEIAQREIDEIKRQKIEQKKAEKEAADAVARAAAIAHAKSLGFTDEMIAVMYPNLGENNE
jgi:hypothetical protein